MQRSRFFDIDDKGFQRAILFGVAAPIPPLFALVVYLSWAVIG